MNQPRKKPISDQTELFRQILITLLKRTDDQTIATNQLTKQVQSLNKQIHGLIIDAFSTRKGSVVPKGKREITTAVALVIYALTVLALAWKGCAF